VIDYCADGAMAPLILDETGVGQYNLSAAAVIGGRTGVIEAERFFRIDNASGAAKAQLMPTALPQPQPQAQPQPAAPTVEAEAEAGAGAGGAGAGPRAPPPARAQFEIVGLRTGSVLGYPHVRGIAPSAEFTARVSSDGGSGTIEFHAGREGTAADPVVATCAVRTTGGWGRYETLPCTRTAAAAAVGGEASLTLTFAGEGSGEFVHLDYFTVTAASAERPGLLEVIRQMGEQITALTTQVVELVAGVKALKGEAQGQGAGIHENMGMAATAV
jgi:hypothetical protein